MARLGLWLIKLFYFTRPVVLLSGVFVATWAGMTIVFLTQGGMGFAGSLGLGFATTLGCAVIVTIAYYIPTILPPP